MRRGAASPKSPGEPNGAGGAPTSGARGGKVGDPPGTGWVSAQKPAGGEGAGEMREAPVFGPPADPPVRATIVYNNNPVAVCPDSEKVITGFAREDLFCVVMDSFMTDTADYADIVLPATTQLEHHDVHKSYGHLYVLGNSPAIAPPTTAGQTGGPGPVPSAISVLARIRKTGRARVTSCCLRRGALR